MIGDKASPSDFILEGCDFYSLERQRQLDLSIVKLLPEKHYGRKISDISWQYEMVQNKFLKQMMTIMLIPSSGQKETELFQPTRFRKKVG